MEYGRSRPLDVHKWSDYPEIDKGLINQLARELSLQTAKQKKHLKVVILDLYTSHESLWIAYSRVKNNYQKASRYNKLHIGYKPLIQVIDSLERYGYIEHKKGFKDRSTGIGYQSRMRATKKLIKLIEARRVKASMIKEYELEEVILLKDQEGKLVEYEDTTLTMLMRIQLQIINQYLSRSLIDLDISDKELEELEQRIAPIDFSRTRLKRIFNNGSFEQGGRFYHGWWQQIPKEYRQYIVINSQVTTELDYSGLHFRMLYATEGLEPPEDPYQVEKLAGVDRTMIKKITNILLNAKSLLSAKRAISQEYPENPSELTILAIQEKHKSIEKYFHTGMGIQLQYWDSVIAEQVMLAMNDKCWQPCLPVHDSFLVTRGSEHRLKECMEEAFNEIYPAIEAAIKRSHTNVKEDKWTTTEEGHNRIRTSAIPRVKFEENPRAAARRRELIERIEAQDNWAWKPYVHTKWGRSKEGNDDRDLGYAVLSQRK
ncbi:hypothetical protein [Nitrosococcus oceani]|uniref:hypothetical protein n=1 Tax=Nitrosococcus oceani TaxID=1229 RepID=UPI00055C24F4|nr:hypothetical protein [Nitrosococcus oceani]